MIGTKKFIFLPISKIWTYLSAKLHLKKVIPQKQNLSVKKWQISKIFVFLEITLFGCIFAQSYVHIFEIYGKLRIFYNKYVIFPSNNLHTLLRGFFDFLGSKNESTLLNTHFFRPLPFKVFRIGLSCRRSCWGE